LYKMGIRGKTLRLLNNSYQDLVSNVVLDGKRSVDIKVQQSVRQGSILGPWFYMLYVHDLAVSLLQSDFGAKIGQTLCGAVLQADDIALSALTVSGLQSMVKCCEQYSRYWRFNYNPVKSKVLVFGESVRRKQLAHMRHSVKLYGQTVEEVTSCDHVGVTLNVFFNSADRSTTAAAKMFVWR
jgi:hypothetical protein